jgi:uncharacterized protein (DUF885 family)
MPTINLDDLVNPSRLPRVTLFSREVVVHPLTGASAHKVAALQTDDNGAAMLGALLEVVASSCSDLTPEEVARLSVDQVAALVQLSRGQVVEVEQMLAERSAKN